MSMWEIESLIEDGINLVGDMPVVNEEKIQLIGNLYAIQQQFDCSFTNFRVMDVLLAAGYTKTVAYTEHPDYLGNEAYFDALLGADDISFVYRDIRQEWSAENEMVAYIERQSGLLYIDVGSPLRKETALALMNIFDLGLLLIRAAHQRNNKGMVYDWTAFLLNIGAGYLEKTEGVEAVIEKYFKEIKEIWLSYDYADYEPLHDSLTCTVAEMGILSL